MQACVILFWLQWTCSYMCACVCVCTNYLTLESVTFLVCFCFLFLFSIAVFFYRWKTSLMFCSSSLISTTSILIYYFSFGSHRRHHFHRWPPRVSARGWVCRGWGGGCTGKRGHREYLLTSRLSPPTPDSGSSAVNALYVYNNNNWCPTFVLYSAAWGPVATDMHT